MDLVPYSGIMDAPLSARRPGASKPGGINTLPPDPYDPRVKIARVGKQMGIPTLGQQQVTNRSIYHAVLLGASAAVIPQGFQLQFFTNLNAAAFPYTNISKNTFDAGESLIIQYVNWSVWTVTVASNTITNIQTIEQFLPGLNAMSWSLLISGVQVIKDFSNLASAAEWNANSQWGQNISASVNNGQAYIKLESEPCIVPNRPFTVSAQIPTGTLPTSAGTAYYLCCNFAGIGTLPNVQNTL
jgi:hypothetical protein